MAKIPSKFWAEESRESAHKDIKKDLEKAGKIPKAGKAKNPKKKTGKTKKGGKVEKVMKEFKYGTLHSGSKKGPKITNRKQAVAVALSEARKAGAKIPKKKK